MADDNEIDASEKTANTLVGFSCTPAITELLVAFAKPIAKAAGNGIARHVQKMIADKKDQRSRQNLHDHIIQVRERIRKKNPKLQLEIKLSVTQQQEDFFADWVDYVQYINPEDSELSQLWQDLMARIVVGEKVSSELVRVLKTLTPGEACFLLNKKQKKRAARKWPLNLFYISSRTDLFYARSLNQKQLIEHSYVLLAVFILGSILALGFIGYDLYVTQSWHWVSLQEKERRIELVLIILAVIAIPLFFATKFLFFWRFSWLGKEMIRLAGTNEVA
jgi:hypothetical protein